MEKGRNFFGLLAEYKSTPEDPKKGCHRWFSLDLYLGVGLHDGGKRMGNGSVPPPRPARLFRCYPIRIFLRSGMDPKSAEYKAKKAKAADFLWVAVDIGPLLLGVGGGSYVR